MDTIKRQHNKTYQNKILFLFVDLIGLNIAFILAYCCLSGKPAIPYTSQNYLYLTVVEAAATVLGAFLLGNYHQIMHRGYAQELLSVVFLTLISMSFTALYLFMFNKDTSIYRSPVIFTYILALPINWTLRIACKKCLKNQTKRWRKQGKYEATAYIVSDSKNIVSLLDLVSQGSKIYRIQGIALVDGENVVTNVDIPVVCDLEEAAMAICRNWVDEVYVYLPTGTTPVASFLDHCRTMGVTVHVLLDLQDVDADKQFVTKLGNQTALTTVYNRITDKQVFIKRTADIVCGLIGSLLTVIIALFIGPIIYIKSPGKIFFKQKRVGLNGKEFYMYKFRSMHPNLDQEKEKYLSKNRMSDSRMFKLDFDPRVIGNQILSNGKKKFGFGEWLRKTSLDEFPQFFNILKGDMSLVGTRPPTVDEWEQYKYHHRARLATRPGLTGMWQISGRSEITDFEEVVRLDTWYITHFTMVLDIKIIIKTVLILFKQKGAL